MHGHKLTSAVAATVGTSLLVVCLVAGCAPGEPTNPGTESGAATPARPTDPAAYESYISHTAGDRSVEYKTNTNDLGADVVLRVSPTQARKPAGDLRDVVTHVGDTVKVVVSSDTAGTLKVPGYRDATTSVQPGETSSVEFTIAKEGSTPVTFEPSGSVLATLAVVG